MKNNSWNIFVYAHIGLLLWAFLFIVSLFIPDGGKAAGVLAVGNILFLFVNIPLSIFSLLFKVKDRVSIEYETPVVMLSILNIIVGIIAWFFVLFLMQIPQLG